MKLQDLSFEHTQKSAQIVANAELEKRICGEKSNGPARKKLRRLGAEKGERKGCSEATG
jgi:hypothetical protein